MPTTVVLTEVIDHGNYIEVRWGDGTGRYYSDISKITELVTSHDNNEELTKDLAIAWALARSPDLSTIATIANKNFTFNMSNPNPIRVQ